VREQRVRWVAAATGILGTGLLIVGPFGSSLSAHAQFRDERPPAGLAAEADAVASVVADLLHGRRGLFVFGWSERRHHGLGEAVPVALRLDSGQVNAGRDMAGPVVLGVLSRRPSLEAAGFRSAASVEVGRGEWVHLVLLGDGEGGLRRWPTLCVLLADREGTGFELSGRHVELPSDVPLRCESSSDAGPMVPP
jgi:hypothetical protein